MIEGVPEVAATGVIPAGFWRRVAAWVIDVVLITTGAYLVGIFLWPDLMIETRTQTAGASGAQLEIVTYALSTHGWVIHGVALWAYTATAGERAGPGDARQANASAPGYGPPRRPHLPARGELPQLAALAPRPAQHPRPPRCRRAW